ncbi:Putative xanthine dehydrogenase YagS FAD-binding subunit [bacterium HR33]|nr:Putative xanthine dehydrogenase YagS FAD-binding subunit [bacterium HR33]
MDSLGFHRASSFEEAAGLLHSGAAVLAGGTDLVPLLKDGLVKPSLLVFIGDIPGAASISVTRRGGARIGAAAKLTDIANNPGVRRLFPALAEACRSVGTLQIRNVATLGGNLCQRPRCWYYRSGIACFKSGGESCPARDGLDEALAILGGGPCWAVHPSDPAVALLALDAKITIRRADGSVRETSLADFYCLPSDRLDRETRLDAGEIVERITVPARYAGSPQRYAKVTQRAAWDFALVSAAVVWEKRRFRPRIALGGVAPRPWLLDTARLSDPPVSRRGRDPTAWELWAIRTAEQALRGSRALSSNGYKIELAKNLIRRTLLEWRRV